MDQSCAGDTVDELQDHTLSREGRTWVAYRTFRRTTDGSWGWTPILRGLFNRRVPAGSYTSREEAQAAAEAWWGYAAR